MVIDVDLSNVPPELALRDADDMTAFSVRVNRPRETFVTREALLELAGVRASDPKWLAALDAMVSYSADKGWIRDGDGAIQAHLEWQS